jgi:hypothetical protein
MLVSRHLDIARIAPLNSQQNNSGNKEVEKRHILSVKPFPKPCAAGININPVRTKNRNNPSGKRPRAKHH